MQVLLCICHARLRSNIPESIARMDAIKTSDPELWQSFNNGEFAVNTSNRIPFTRIGVDQAMEHLNKSTKGQGGISGITYPATLLKFCLTAPELARLAEGSERLVATTSTTAPAKQPARQPHRSLPDCWSSLGHPERVSIWKK